ncbi:MAG: FAD-dependent oxidoreductase, partial [Alphaproteobacteria bacterium]|nr:FAD-dependent oxidoreductase [Alphaproteobacteria bacterium]
MSADLAIVGAGPAGMAAAVEGAAHGLSVTVLDDQPEPGGQIYRGIERAGSDLCALLGEDYEAGRALVADFRRAQIDYRPNSMVWRLDPGARIAYSRDRVASIVTAHHVLIATGAMERPVPIPGAERPGVMGAGAAQVLLKASGLVPTGRIVLAGSGPLLLLVGCQLLNAGATVAAVLETTESGDYLNAAPALPSALVGGWRDLVRGLAMKRRLKRAGVEIRAGVSGLAATGGAVQFDAGEIACDLLLLHEGVIPQTHLARQAGLAHCWHAEQRHWMPVVDPLGRTEQETLLVAGDAGGIAGARAAVLTGRIAARVAAGADPGRLIAALDRER